MTPLMTLNGDDIVEASQLRPTVEEPGPSPTPEEEAALMGEEDEPSEVPGPTPRHSEIPRFVESAELTTTPVTSAVPCLASEPHSHPSQKAKKLWEGIDVDPNNPGKWIQAYLERDNRLPEWWKQFILLSTLWTGVVMMPKSKVKLASKLWPSACQMPRRKYMVPGPPNPVWQCYEGENTLPQKTQG